MRVLWLALAAGLVLLIALVLVASAGSGRAPAPWLTARPIAHRGLWAATPERPENSLAAFAAAVESDFAIELDVQRSGDGATVVIHDAELDGMTGQPGMVSETTLAELQERRLLGGDETIPTLQEALALVDGRVPVFVEIKNEGEVGALEDDVAAQLSKYDGDVAVMSFNPFSLARVAETAPSVPRGQLSGAFEGEDLAWYEVFLLRNLLMNWKSRPDFIAYDVKELPSAVTTIQRWRGRPLLAWTAEDKAGWDAAQELADAVIADPGALPAQ